MKGPDLNSGPARPTRLGGPHHRISSGGAFQYPEPVQIITCHQTGPLSQESAAVILTSHALRAGRGMKPADKNPDSRRRHFIVERVDLAA